MSTLPYQASSIARWFAAGSLVIAIAGSTGCSKQETASARQGGDAGLVANPAVDAEASEAVVSQFLDRIRRGGENHNAMSLLTKTAQMELNRIGQTVQPIGSPDAQFEVTRSTAAPATQETQGSTGRLVHCIWREPAQIGSDGRAVVPAQNYQVVWSVEPEQGQWRISGLVLETDPNQPPVVLDFENGELMAKILGGSPAAATATAPSESGGSQQLR